MKRRIASMLSLLLVMVLCTQAMCFEAWAASEEVFTCREAAQLLRASADTYLPEVTAEDILGEEPPDAALTNAIGARMLLRAFGPLPEPHYLRVLLGYWDTHFADVPEDCAEAVENLTSAGIYNPEDAAAFQPDEPMTREALTLLVDRIHAYLGASPRNDFCNTVNHDYYYETETEIGEDLSWGSNSAERCPDTDAIAQWYIDTLNEALEGDGSDPDLRNIAAFMSTWMDMEARNSAIEELRPYLDGIEEARTAAELMDVFARISRELGVVLLNEELDKPYTVPFTVSSSHRPFYCFERVLGVPLSYTEGSSSYAILHEQTSRMLQEYGWEQARADEATRAYLDYFRDAAVMYETSAVDWKTISNFDEFDAAMPNLPFRQYMEKAGYPEDCNISFANIGVTGCLLSCFDDEHLEGLRVYGLRQLLMAFQCALAV